MDGFLSGDEDPDRLGLGGLGRGMDGVVDLVLSDGRGGLRLRFDSGGLQRRVMTEAEAEPDRRERSDRGETESHDAPLQTSTSTVWVAALEAAMTAGARGGLAGAPRIADQARSR